MIQKLQFISRILLLVCLPAFILKPVLMSVVNSLQNSKTSQTKALGDSPSGLKVHYVKEHSVKREEGQISALRPCFQKTIPTSSMGRLLAFASGSIQHSPAGTLILRI